MAVATRSSSSPSRRYPKERNSVEVGSDSDTLVEHEDQSRTETTVKTTATARSNDVTHQQLSRKGPMRATWHHKPLDEQSFFEKFLSVAGVLQDPPGSERPPVFAKDEPMPYMPIWRQHLWAFPRAVLPLIAHRAFTELTGRTVPPGIAGPLYLGYFFLFGIDVFATLRRMGKKYGFLDGEVPRDGIPDDDVTRVAVGLFNVILFRCIFAFIFVYDQHETISIQWYWPVQLAAYAIILDFWFYWYHRLMHEVPALWRFHRKHHTTKHPNAALGAFADHEQEIGDMLLIPVMTWLVYRIDFVST
ncbi:hypothetical protein IE53DRAFT_392425 [Violaceomyces palustris]|uniref:Uncharacterized protein n=1 Tax=Violaceomyces palustris TaxID=1673888 RepID=A0ACD0NL83_9BASI|nr:hypothetical protein IE53DRAFT_392425 [Violaceomyces palustris]